MVEGRKAKQFKEEYDKKVEKLKESGEDKYLIDLSLKSEENVTEEEILKDDDPDTKIVMKKEISSS